MSAIVVADTSPLNYLVLSDAIEVLPVSFDRVTIPTAVAAKLQHPRTPAPVRKWISSLPEWAHVLKPTQVDLSVKLGRGETEAIALALELGARAVLMDDSRARMEAIRKGLVVVGTLAILETAADRNLLDLAVALGALRKTTFHIRPHLLDEALERHQQRLKLDREQSAPPHSPDRNPEIGP